MFTSVYSKINEPCNHVISSSYMKLTPVDVVDGSVVVRSSEFKEFSPKTLLHQVSFHDLDIANILSIGATNVLKPVVMNRMSDFSLVDKFSIDFAKFNSSNHDAA